jgi:tetratricopeptide (TPR) repeat protein
VPDRLLVDLYADGRATLSTWPEGGLSQEVIRIPLAWPLNAGDLEDLRWYLEDYLRAPFGVWEDLGPAVAAKLAGWGEQVFGSVFGSGPARDAYQRARDRGLEVVFRSADPDLLGLPWELMRDGVGPVALGAGGMSRSLPVAEPAQTLGVPGGRLRVLMVISRPRGIADVGYQMVARALMERLEAVRGDVYLTVLRPPTFDALRQAVRQAADDGEPFHVVHFDGHGIMPGRRAGGGSIADSRSSMMTGLGEGALAFEKPDGGNDHVPASRVATALAEGKVPVMVLNACQSGAMGKDLEASVATALLRAGCAAVVAMAYSLYAVAAAEFIAVFYESLLTGASVGQAVTAGRRRLAERDGRPSPKGDMPLADWLVPVHYLRREVRFPQARTQRPAALPSLDAALDQIRAAPAGSPAGSPAAQDVLAAVDGLFVGRDDLFYQLESAVRLQRVVLLTGAGGTGKTELAKGFARWWRDTGGVDDPQLVVWHSFEPGLASFGLDGAISALGLAVFGTDFAHLDPDQRLAAVKQLLAQFRALLIWDQFETVREMPGPAGAMPPLDETGCAALKDFVEWVRDHSNSAVIITSRVQEDWLGQARRIEVGGLNRQEAAEYADYLLAPYPAARAQRERRSFGQLLEWLDGHPLAMRLTLPRLDATGPADLLAALQGTSPLPTEDGPEAGRTTSLPASITYSYAHLAEPTRRLLPAVSLFHGVADEDVLMVFSATEGVPDRFVDVSKQEWTAVLEDATRVGLLNSLGAGMYRISPALPSYLAAGWQIEDPADYDQEREACEQALCSACAVFSQWLTGQIESGDAALSYAVIGLQRRTLSTMLGHALDRHAWENAEDIVRALDAYWDTRSAGGEAAVWADRILAATTVPGQNAPVAEPGASSLWLYTTIQQGNKQKDTGQSDQAAQTYRQALAYLQDQPDAEWTHSSISVLYHQLGMTAQQRGLLDEADDWYRRAIQIREELGLRALLATDYHQLGSVAQQGGRLDEADEWYGKALTIKEELGDRPGMAATYHQLGITAQDRGRLDEADEWYRRALTIFEEFGDRPRMAITYHQLGMTAQDRGRLDEADEWYRRALTIDEELGNRPYVAEACHQLGTTALRRDRLDEADDWYRRALTIEEDLSDRPNMAATHHQLGITAQRFGRLDEADEWYRKSLTISEELGDRSNMAVTYHQLGIIAQDRGRLDEADEWYRKSLTIREDLGDSLRVAVIYHQLGMTAQDRGRLDEADEWYRKSLTIKEERGDRPGMALSYAQLGLLAEERGQPRQAIEWNIRCVTLFSQFPSPMTGTGPAALTRLTHQLGILVLEQAWEQVTGQPVPQAVRDYITMHRDGATRKKATADPVADAARSAAAILAPDLGSNMAAEVEGALAARGVPQRPDRYLDPVSLASLIVSIASLAWNVYNDQRKRNPEPLPSSVARQVRVALREQDTPLPPGIERITEVVANEITGLASPTR